MKYLSFRMENEKYQRLNAVINSTTGKTPAKFFADLADKIISGNEGFSDKLPEDDYALNNVRQIRFSDTMLQQLNTASKENRWSLAKEVRYRINQTLTSDPVLLDNEIAELKGARNAVDRIGQNIYHIIAKRQMLTVNDPDMWKDIKELNLLISDIKDQVNAVLTVRSNVLNVKKPRRSTNEH